MSRLIEFKKFQFSLQKLKNIIGGTVNVIIIREPCLDESGNPAAFITCITPGLGPCANDTTCYYDPNGNLVGSYPSNCQTYCMA